MTPSRPILFGIFALLICGGFALIVYQNNYFISKIASDYIRGHNRTKLFARNSDPKTNENGRKENDSFLKQDAFKTALLFWRQGSLEERRFSVCGDKWQDRYRKLHGDILQNLQPKRFLIYSCGGRGYGCGGYGNRIYAVASLFLLAVLTDRAFIIDWPDNSMNLFWEQKNINWKLPLSKLNELDSRRHFWCRGNAKKLGKDVLRPGRTFGSFVKWILEEDISNYFNSSVEIITTCWYLADVFLINPSLRNRALQFKRSLQHSKYSFIGCAFDFLFQKTPGFLEQLYAAKKSIGISGEVPVIGLHVRIGDVTFGIRGVGPGMKNFQIFFECAKKAENRILEVVHDIERDKIKWFLATDNARVKSYASLNYSDKVVTLDITPRHIDKFSNQPLTSQGILGVFLDHFILSESDVLILSKSSFGSTAQALTFHPTAVLSYGEECIF